MDRDLVDNYLVTARRHESIANSIERLTTALRQSPGPDWPFLRIAESWLAFHREAAEKYRGWSVEVAARMRELGKEEVES